jgi:hypothetical protein
MKFVPIWHVFLLENCSDLKIVPIIFSNLKFFLIRNLFRFKICSNLNFKICFNFEICSNLKLIQFFTVSKTVQILKNTIEKETKRKNKREKYTGPAQHPTWDERQLLLTDQLGVKDLRTTLGCTCATHHSMQAWQNGSRRSQAIWTAKAEITGFHTKICYLLPWEKNDAIPWSSFSRNERPGRRGASTSKMHLQSLNSMATSKTVLEHGVCSNTVLKLV